MADDKNKTAADRKHINVDDENEVRYWATRFEVSENELEAAIQKVGTNLDDVARELVGPRPINPN